MSILSTDPDIEQFRKECEARQVLDWPFEKRKPFLQMVGKRRGIAAQKELEREIMRQHKLRRQAA